MILHSRAEAPRSLAGYTLWLQTRHGGLWLTVCELRPKDAKDVLRFLDREPSCLHLRVSAEKLGA